MKNVTSFIILLAGFYIATVCAIQDAHENNDIDDILYRVNSKNLNNENSVYNFQSVCEQLCGTGFGGPICGAQCGLQINDYLKNEEKSSDESSELIKKSDDVCPILCESGLGIPNCKCSIRAKREVHFNIQPVCDSLCSANVFIKGCGTCGRKLEDTNENVAENGTTTPNWALYCIELCRTGDGGILCECDLPPFF